MASTLINRRRALKSLVVLASSAAAPAVLLACNGKPTCLDVSGLTPDEQRARHDTAQYVDAAADPAKKCSSCVQFVPGPQNKCGSCKVVKGPINPDGGCKLWTAKPA